MSIEAFDNGMFSVPRASKYARRLLAEVAAHEHDQEAVEARVEQRYGIGFWQLMHLAKGRAKGCDITLFGRLYAGYLEICRRELAKAEHELAVEKATDNDDLENLEAEARALAAKIAAKKAALGKR